MENKEIKDNIKKLIDSIQPYDALEKKHIENASNWLASGVNVFRIQKDAIPPKHLAGYSVVVDILNEKILLLDHKKSLLMLPSGGHVNKNEMPMEAAKRELKEEL